jgi:hypothetical protein
MKWLDPVPVFRLNIDLWREYRWSINPDGYFLQDPTGRSCRSQHVQAVYLRKLIFNPPYIDQPASGCEEAWCREEVMQIWHGIHDMAVQDGCLALVQPSPHGRWTKIRQMTVAKQFFRVPAWEMFHGSPTAEFEHAVVKTQGNLLPGSGGVMMVRAVELEKLSPDYPWFVQQQVTSATHDVTVVYINGRCFAFECARDQFQGVDCRIPTTTGEASWRRCALSAAEEAHVQDFMRVTAHRFGRLDFLRDKEGLWFLELNPNGQFAWLDMDGREGLLEAVAAEILAVYHGSKRS